jgi:hypothetical protein
VQGAAQLGIGRQQDVHVQRLQPEPVREPVNPVLRRAEQLDVPSVFTSNGDSFVLARLHWQPSGS